MGVQWGLNQRVLHTDALETRRNRVWWGLSVDFDSKTIFSGVLAVYRLRTRRVRTVCFVLLGAERGLVALYFSQQRHKPPFMTVEQTNYR